MRLGKQQRLSKNVSMRWECIMDNITLNLCHGGLQKVREAEHFKVTLTENEITYRESVGDVSPSMSIPDPSTS